MNRIKYVDALKFVAIFSIILLHISGIWGTNTEFLGFKFNSLKEFVGWGVSLFLMLTGMLALNKDIDLKLFFKKKAIRLFYPLVFFFIIAYLLNVYTDFLTVYWYCWMIIAVYFSIPLINIFIKNADEKYIEYFIAIFIFSSLICTLAKIFSIRFALDMDFFIGPTSYLILGYYLSRKEFNISSNKLILLSLGIFLLVSIIKVNFPNTLYINNNAIVYSFLNLDILQIVQTASVFIFVKYLYESSNGIFFKIRNILEKDLINGFILSISRSSYGIYLLHMIIFRKYQTVLENIHMTGTMTFISIIGISFALLLFSWVLILILSKIPILNRFSGYY